MSRGRNKELTRLRFLLEVLLHQRGQVSTTELVATTQFSDQTVRNRGEELQKDGLIEIERFGNTKTYRLTDDGHEQLTEELRNFAN